MGNLKKTLDTQKAINEAVEAIFKHFKEDTSYADTIETMADAQVEFMELMEINRQIAACSYPGMNSIPTTSITNFVFEFNTIIKLLKPFATLLGQVYGNE